MKLSQASGAPQIKPAEVAPVKAVPQKNSVITCVKGKISKKISGANPKCPVGYKKR
jgi:hypothetical protein